MIATRLLHILIPLVFCAASCGKPPSQRQSSAPEETAEAPPPPKPIVKYDEEGIRMPDEALPMGTPIPLGFDQVTEGKGWVRCAGYLDAEQVIRFYRKYLTLPEGTAPHEVGRSTLFREASPKQPGNPGRKVQVRVIPEQGGTRTAVLILDQDYVERMDEEELSGTRLMDPEDWKPSRPGDVPPEDLL